MGDRASVRPHVGARQGIRAVVLGLLITGVSGAAHGTHGHLPSPMLLAVTALLVTIACLPLCRSRLTVRSLVMLLVVGEMLLHAWLAWFDLPVTGSPKTTTAHLMHGDHVFVTLAPRDFSALIPQPTMVVVHVLAAVVLAMVIVHADGLADRARALLGLLLAAVRHVLDVPARERTSISWTARIEPTIHDFVHAVRRRGPPSVACAAV